MIQSTRSVPLGAVSTHGAVSLLERARDAFVAWRTARATAIALAELSDQQLADIGVVRGGITALAAAHARR